MKPIIHVLFINLSLYLIGFLLLFLVLKKPEFIPIFTGIIGLVNMLGAGLFFAGKNAAIGRAFLLGLFLAAGVTVGGFLWVKEYTKTVRVDENVTT